MLADVLRGISEQGLPVLVVNDGCTDDTSSILQAWLAEQNGSPTRTVITHAVNRGKADALRTGFVEAAKLGYTHAVTIDTDGQLDPTQIAELLAMSRQHPSALILGDRDSTAPDYPQKSIAGRKVSNLMVAWESGATISDSQCGFRVYPIFLTQMLRCNAGRYGFETEILTRAAWAGAEIRHVPVQCSYDVPGGRVSHLRPGRDTVRGIAMHVGLLVRSFMPWGVPRIDPADHPRATGTIWLRLLRWFNPMRAWRQVRDEPNGRSRFAAALALGVFIANLPLYGVQTVLGLYLARQLKLHPVPVVVGSHLSTPPVGPVLIVAGIMVGHFLLHGDWPSLQYFKPSVNG
ncbi:hypothetical protein BH10PLA1_BH10PLA1_23150 [soil metagenome]